MRYGVGFSIGILGMIAWMLTTAVDGCHDRPRYPLHHAAARGDIATLDRLIAKGAKLDALDDKGNTALYLAVSQHQEDAVEALLKAGATVDTINKSGETPLFGAYDPRITSLLLQYGANPNIQNINGVTPLLRLIGVGDMGEAGWRCRLLLEHGANPNIPDKDGTTPLMMASESCNSEAVYLLLKKGARVNDHDSISGRTCLHMAYNKKVIEKLIAAGADVNAIDDKGQTPLHIAVEFAANSFEAPDEERRMLYDRIRLLLDNGANINARTKDGETPLGIALKYRDNHDAAEVIKLLRDRGGVE